jgi:hypothetical protein
MIHRLKLRKKQRKLMGEREREHLHLYSEKQTKELRAVLVLR